MSDIVIAHVQVAGHLVARNLLTRALIFFSCSTVTPRQLAHGLLLCLDQRLQMADAAVDAVQG